MLAIIQWVAMGMLGFGAAATLFDFIMLSPTLSSGENFNFLLINNLLLSGIGVTYLLNKIENFKRG